MTAITINNEIFTQFKALIDDQNSTIEEFSEVANSAPYFRTRLLNLVNSQFFGCTGPIDNIVSAINLIGIGQLYDMIVQIYEMEAFQLPFNSENNSKPKTFIPKFGFSTQALNLKCPC